MEMNVGFKEDTRVLSFDEWYELLKQNTDNKAEFDRIFELQISGD